ncbi:MAG TPA: 2Fe-2S iron-sulfur cluster-binding protein [Dehalococcoidia bacterium]|nr:2Fe-2S iron-sulfur cluster-binding protein [Dehalococcoidia bacterium]
MTRVRVEPAGIEFEAAQGETIMAAAHAAGYYWPTTCGGQAICTTCALVVVEGQDLVDSMGRSERKALTEGRTAAAAQRYRLACQARIAGAGAVVIEKRGVRRSDSA